MHGPHFRRAISAHFRFRCFFTASHLLCLNCSRDCFGLLLQSYFRRGPIKVLMTDHTHKTQQLCCLTALHGFPEEVSGFLGSLITLEPNWLGCGPIPTPPRQLGGEAGWFHLRLPL